MQTKKQPTKAIIYCRNHWPSCFFLLLLLPIWRDEWISSSSNFSSLSHVFIYPFFFPPLLFLLLNPSHPPSFRPIRHTLIFGALPPHSPPTHPPYLQQGNIYSAPLLFAITLYHFLHPSFFCCFSPPVTFITCRCSFFFPLLSSLVAFFHFSTIFSFSPLLLLNTCKTFNIHHEIWPMCVLKRGTNMMGKKVKIRHFSHSVKKWERKRGRRKEESVGDVNIGDKEQRLIKRSTKE